MSEALLPFIVRAGSVIGREHQRLGRNGQDGLAVGAWPERLVAVVTDGCGSGRCSEVGAKVGARMLLELVERHVAQAKDAEGLASAVTDGLVARLEGVRSAVADDSGRRLEVLREYLLFTFLVVVADVRRTVVFGVGDGLYALNGGVVALDSGPQNAPDYVGYRLCEGLPPVAPVVHVDVPTAQVATLVLATDGARPLMEGPERAELEREPRYLGNPSLVQKRLTALADRGRRFTDDATVVVVRRSSGEGPTWTS